MACFVAPLAAAATVTAVRKRISPRYRVNWLMALLWGGVAWLVPEHIYHGEVVFYPPFFTAGTREMLSEIVGVGIPQVMAALLVWAVLIAVSSSVAQRRFRPNLIGLMFIGAVVMTCVDLLLA